MTGDHVVYFETSAVLSWLLHEPLAAWVKLHIDNADAVYTSVLTLVEAERGLDRAAFRAKITAAQHEVLAKLLAEERQAWNLVEVSAKIRKRAGQLFPIEPVRTLDALHLSTALFLSTRDVPKLRILSLDRRICQNADALGFLKLPDRREKKGDRRVGREPSRTGSDNRRVSATDRRVTVCPWESSGGL